jgi:epoxyqueuosine reductase
VRAGLGTIGKNACLITPQFGSWVVLAAMVLNTAVDGDRRDHRGDDVCGRCRICVDSCPTGAIVEDRVIDARKCLSYQTIENEGPIPEPLRPQLRDLVFGCDVCQDVCPHNTSPVLAAQRFAPRPVGSLTAQALAGLSKEQWQALAPGTPLARAGYDGVRRNAAYALGATKAHDSRAVLERLCGDQSELVREAAQWALTQLA